MTRNLPAVQDDRSLEKASPLQIYLREVARYPLLSPEEELNYAKQHYDDKDVSAAHRLVTANLRLVVKIANDFKRAQTSLLDLIQEGNYGLMQAVKRFNPYKGVKLSSYAGWWIRAYILQYIMDNKSQVKIGTTVAQRKLYYNLQKETEKLLREYDEADPKVLAEKLDVKEKEVREMQLRLGAPDVSLDAPVSNSEESGATRGSLIADDAVDVESETISNQIKSVFKEQLAEFAKTLGERDLEIFKMRMMAEEPSTLQKVGDRFGFSRERARQLEAKILKDLKAFIQDKGVIDV